MKRILWLLVALTVMAAGLVGCSRYVSRYSAVGFVHSNDSDSAFMTFVRFDGQMVFKLKCDSEKEAQIQYSGQLEEGSITVYYDCGETKKELFTLGAGNEIESSGGDLSGKTVYIIVETSEKCKNGKLDFEICYE